VGAGTLPAPSVYKEQTVKVDLMKGIVPISKAASQLAALIRRTQQDGQPIGITQKGYVQAILVDVAVWQDVTGELDELRRRVAELEGKG
jgi:prevent-host-death family protein